jgi:hypothetical protein
MKSLPLLLGALLVAVNVAVDVAVAAEPTAPAPAPATALAAAIKQARAAAERDNGALWGRSLAAIPFMLVAGNEATLSEDPHQAGYRRVGELWVGPQPPSLPASNSSVPFAGRTWAMVRLPLPERDAVATRLLLHEAFHALQAEVLPLPPFDALPAGAAILDEPDGRIWLQLEWRALAAALTTRGAEQDLAVERALVFRARRFALASVDERTRETLLDVSEGMAEYTGLRLAGAGATDFAARLQHDGPARKSFIREFCYFTGPAYGFLLEARRPGWRTSLRQQHDLAVLLAETLQPEQRPGAGDLGGRARQAGAAFGLDELTLREAARWKTRQEHIAAVRRLFVDGPLLRLRPLEMRIGFNTDEQVSLGEAGTVMSNLTWREEHGGALDAPGGALLTNDWRELRVPIGPMTVVAAGVSPAPRELHGPGWTLTLPPGWRLSQEGATWVATPR